MLNIIVDSNIIIRDYFLKGYDFNMLLEYVNDFSENEGVTLYVPEVSIKEVVNKYYEELASAKKILKKLVDNDDFLTFKKYENYHDALLRRIFDLGIKILFTPEVGHTEIIDRAYAKKKPFSNSSELGYKDYLIWKSILKLASYVGDIVFISENKKDFSSRSKNSFHEDYLDDIQALSIDSSRFKYYSSMFEFISSVVRPMKDMKQEIVNIFSDAERVDSDIKPFIKSFMENSQMDEFEHILPSVYEDITLTIVEEIYSVKLVDTKVFTSQSPIAVVECKMSCAFDFMIPKFELELLDEKKYPIIFNADWNKYTAFAGDSLDVVAQFYMAYDEENKDVTSILLSSLHLADFDELTEE